MWFDGANPQPAGPIRQRQGDSRCQAAPAATDQHIRAADTRFGHLFGDFETNGALTRYHLRVVVGFHQRQAEGLRQRLSLGLAILARPVIQHHLRAKRFGIFTL